MDKKISKIISIVFLLFFVVGCSSNQNNVDKKDFYLNEEATIDNMKITLNDIVETNYFQDVLPENDTYLVLEFKITNTSSDTVISIDPNSFYLNLDDSNIIDLNHNKSISLEPSESIMYQTIFDVLDNDIYHITFKGLEKEIQFITR